MRHYKVAKVYADKCSSEVFDREGLDYNMADVYNQDPIELRTSKLYCSDMKRARLTARHAFGREAEILSGVYEITMKSFKYCDSIKSTWYWEMMARIAWRLNHPSQFETKVDTYKRLNRAIDILESRGEDATIVMHGMAMRHLSLLLKKRGYRGKRAWKAKNGECFEYIKEK